MPVTADQLLSLYLAYFGRPPDVAGERFYIAGQSELTDVLHGFSASAESLALRGSGFGAAQVNAIYQNLFNRDAEPAGQQYWQDAVGSGRISSAEAALAILQGAQNADKTSVQNKLAVSGAFFAQLDTDREIAGYTGDAAAALARSFLKGVDATSASLGTALAALTAQVDLVTGLTVPVPPGAPAPSFAVAKSGGDIVSFVAAGALVTVTEAGGTFTFTSSGGTAGTGTATAPVAGVVVPGSTTLSIASTLASGKVFTGTGTALVVANTAGEDLTAFTATGVGGYQLTSGQGNTLTAAQALISRIGASGTAGALTDAGTTAVHDTLAALGGGVAATLKANGVDNVVATAATGADLSAISVGGIDSITLASGQNYTLTAAQAALVATAPGTQTVTLATVASGPLLLPAAVESFVLGNFANNVTLGAAAQNVSSPAGTATTLAIGGTTPTGTWALANSADVLVATDGANITGVNTGSATTAENLSLTGGITMTAAQYSAFNTGSIIAAGTTDKITLTTALNTGAMLHAAVENFTLAAGNNSLELGATGQSIDASALGAGEGLSLAGNFAASVTLTAGNLLASGADGGLTVTGGTGANTLTTGAGADTINAGDGADVITGGGGIDTLNGGNGDDTFIFGSMADFLSGSQVVDQIDGGSGTDTVRVDATIAITATDDLASRMTGVEQINAQVQSASTRAYSLVAGAGMLGGLVTVDLSGDTKVASTGLLDFSAATSAMTLKGVAQGTNTITGGAGADTLVGGANNDLFIFGSAAAAALDTVIGGGGSDTVLFRSTAGATLVVGDKFSAGLSYLVTTGSTAGASVGSTAENIDASTHTLGGVTLTGNAGNNTLTGSAGADTLVGGGGNDTVRGGGGNDTITTSTSGATTYVFEAIASGNGVDALAGVRSTGTFNFSAFLGHAGAVQSAAVDATVPTVGLDLTGGSNIGVRFGSTALTSSDILLATDNGVAGEVAVGDNGKAVVFSFSPASSTGSANGSIYYVEDTNAAVGQQTFTVTLVGTMTGSAASITQMAASVTYL
ncbi:MAG: DUF4214 domain-containing protein [Pseudomonadota bacterium]